MSDEGETIWMEPGARPAPTIWVVCPPCLGTGRTGPAERRPCPMCAGTGLVSAEVAGDITDSREMEAGPRETAEPPP